LQTKEEARAQSSVALKETNKKVVKGHRTVSLKLKGSIAASSITSHSKKEPGGFKKTATKRPIKYSGSGLSRVATIEG